MNSIMHLFTLVFGLIAGSFFNVLIWRLPREESILWPPSHCPSCNRAVRPWENIPVISFIFLKGKCHGCKTKISIMYPAVELITALILLFFVKIYPIPTDVPWWNYIEYLLKILSLILIIPISLIDIRHYIIPNQLTIPFGLAALFISFIPGGITPLQSGLGILAGGGSLLLMGVVGTFIFKKGDAMGGGDIKLMTFIGALWGWEIALMSIMFAAFAGSVIGGFMIVLRKLDDSHRIPFGPYLGIGLWVASLAGRDIVEAYIRFIERLFY